MAGNLCRCTGYRPIRDAALALGPAPPGPLRDRLEQPAPALEHVSVRRLLAPADDRRRASRCWRPIPRPRSWPAARISAWNRTCAIGAGRTSSASRRSTSCTSARRHRRACGSARRCRSPTSVGSGAAPLTSGASGSRSLPRRRSGIARRSAAISRPPRRSATLRRCCSRSTRRCTSTGPSRPADAAAVVVLHGIPPDRAQLMASCSPRWRFRGRFPRSCASTRSRSGASTTSAPWRRRWPSIATPRAACAAPGLRSAASPPRRFASAEAERALVGQLWNEAADRARAGRPRSHADADERPSRIDGVPAGGIQEPRREVLVGGARA